MKNDTVLRMKIASAFSVVSHTLLGVFKNEYPVLSGNCFAVEATDGQHYGIVNFNLENWEEVLRRGIELPIQIAIVHKNVAIVHDERIPHEWYSEYWCELCCPDQFLPVTQKLRHDREIRSGFRTDHGHSIQFDPSKSPKL